MTAELKAIALQQNWSEVYNLAETYKNQQQWQLAAVAFKRAVELRSDFFWSYHHLGDVLSQLKQWQEAVQAYSCAIQLDSQFFWSWHNLGSALDKLQQWREAVQAYNRAIQLDSQFFWSWYNCANALCRLEKWDLAIANYLQTIQLQPQHQLVYQKLGTAFQQRCSLEQSIQHYRRLIKSPEDNAIFSCLKTQPQELANIAATLASQHQTIAAIVFYYMILEIEPNQLEVLQQLAQLVEGQNQLEQKLAFRRQRLKSEPNQLLTRLKVNTVQPQRKNLSGKIVVENNCLVLPNQIEDLCLAVGWQPRPLEQVEKALANSFAYVCAWHLEREKQKLIGFGRAVADGVFHATLLDIVVHPDLQGHGVGKKIVENLLEQLQQAKIRDITLFASPHLVDFYHKLGFISQPNNLQWMLFSTINV